MIWVPVVCIGICAAISLLNLGVEGNKLSAEKSCFVSFAWLTVVSIVGLVSTLVIAWRHAS